MFLILLKHCLERGEIPEVISIMKINGKGIKPNDKSNKDSG